MHLLEKWGEGFWILNSAQYQLESKAGTGLMNEHAEYLGLDLNRLISNCCACGFVHVITGAVEFLVGD